jgi:hypothetical protein
MASNIWDDNGVSLYKMLWIPDEVGIKTGKDLLDKRVFSTCIALTYRRTNYEYF